MFLEFVLDDLGAEVFLREFPNLSAFRYKNEIKNEREKEVGKKECVPLWFQRNEEYDVLLLLY